ncbi:hypothetical protein [Archaeoglobus neptunius]|uniref:hypothetical protein n=1 Tax=Archaeoglobus neptunius TaxID=2798580 RepID=UPI001928A789|nr:hypothetical protein [Archaeoglobus neptunius]
MEFIEIDCPICDDGKTHRARILETKKGKFKRRTSEFDATVFIVLCEDCKTKGIVRRVEQINMESYEFPFED